MLGRLIIRVFKTTMAVGVVAVGVGVLVREAYRPLVTEAVTNARLIEIRATADGFLTPILQEGRQFGVGEALAQVAKPVPATAAAVDLFEMSEHFAGLDIASLPPEAGYPLGLEPQDASANVVSVITDIAGPAVDLNAAGIAPPVAPEAALMSSASGLMWQWKEPGGAFFKAGDSVGEFAECSSLLAISQARSADVTGVQTGDPVRFISPNAEWTGTVQRIVAGIPNLSGNFAIRFPGITPDDSLLFFALDVPAAANATCALGIAGQIHYDKDQRPTLQQVGRNTYDRTADFARSFGTMISNTARSVLPEKAL